MPGAIDTMLSHYYRKVVLRIVQACVIIYKLTTVEILYVIDNCNRSTYFAL